MSNTPALVGILNVTPDSFSDGGRYFSPEDAVRAAHVLAESGADIIDIGAESTRPNATPISADEEWNRLQPVLEGLKDFSVPLSIDTRHPETARRALAYGAAWINDVSGLANPEMLQVVKDSAASLVLMHSLTVPADSNITLDNGADPVVEVMHWAEQRFDALEREGIARERIIFDVGIGFGKTAAQSWTLLNNIAAFHAFGVPLLVGHSRKSFLGSTDRDATTLDVSRRMVAAGVQYLRVHDIAAHQIVKKGS
jgi:dihydropteroate synthase